MSSALLYNCKEYVKDIVENAKKATVEVGYAAYVLHLMKDGLTKELVEKIKTLGKSAKSVMVSQLRIKLTLVWSQLTFTGTRVLCVNS